MFLKNGTSYDDLNFSRQLGRNSFGALPTVPDALQGTPPIPKVRPDLEEQPEGADRSAAARSGTPEGGSTTAVEVARAAELRRLGIEALIKLKNWVTKVPVRPKALVK